MGVMDRIFGKGDALPPLLDAVNYDREMEEALATTPALDPITDLLPLSDPGGACRKCRSLALTIDYHQGLHDGCPDLRLQAPPHMLGYWSPQYEARMRRAAERAIEHHDRTCVNCKYRWVEAVA